MPVWWAIEFIDGQAGKLGYLALASDRSQVLGVYFADGSLVPAYPNYGYLTVATDQVPPSWGLSVKDPAAVATIVPPMTITASQFVLLFTPDEAQAIKASTDPIVAQFMLAVEAGSDINLASVTTTNGVGYLAMKGLIDPSRVPQILGNMPHA